MKRSAFVFAFLLSVIALPLYAIRITSVDDVIRLHRSGATHALILQAIAESPEKLEVSREDVIAMREAGLSEELIVAVLDRAKSDPNAPAHETRPADAAAPVEGRTPDEGDECTTYDPPLFIMGGWFIPRWLWDPYWYMPRFYSPAANARSQAPAAQSTQPAKRDARGVAPAREARGTAEPSRISREMPKAERGTTRSPIEHAVGSSIGSKRR